MIGTSFQSIDVDNTISVQDIKASGLKGFDWETFEPGDTLMIWDASAQGYLTTLYYAGDEQTDEMDFVRPLVGPLPSLANDGKCGYSASSQCTSGRW